MSSLKSKGEEKKARWMTIERDGQGRDVLEVNSKSNGLDLLYKFGVQAVCLHVLGFGDMVWVNQMKLPPHRTSKVI